MVRSEKKIVYIMVPFVNLYKYTNEKSYLWLYNDTLNNHFPPEDTIWCTRNRIRRRLKGKIAHNEHFLHLLQYFKSY